MSAERSELVIMKQNLRKTILIAVCLIIPALGTAQQRDKNSKDAKGLAALKKNYVVPSGTTIPLELKSLVNTRTAYVGQPIYCSTIYPIIVNNRVVIPVGSYVKGTITQVVKPGRFKGKGQIGIRFDSISLASGATRSLRATFSGFSGSGNEGFSPSESKVKGPSTGGKNAKTVARRTAALAAWGTVIGAVTGHALRGLAVGSMAGAAMGTVLVATQPRQQIILRPGTDLNLQLEAPLDFAPTDLDN